MNKEQIIASIKFYKALGLENNPKVLKGDKIVNIYHLLGFKPTTSNNGSRHLTPYEILGVPPQFDENNNERPIIFAIKNRTAKIGKYTGSETEFTYSSKRVKEEDSLLEKLKKGYKRAIIAGNQAEAEKYLELIDELTGGRADEFLEGFYDYTKFYRRMKKQLLIDIFSHFFLMFLLERKNSAIVKPGIINKNRIFRAFKEREEEQSYSDELNQILAQNPVPDFPPITKIQFEQVEQDSVLEKHPATNPDQVVFDKREYSKDFEVDYSKLDEQYDKQIEPEHLKFEVEKPVSEDNISQVSYPQTLNDFFENMQKYIGEDNLDFALNDSFEKNNIDENALDMFKAEKVNNFENDKYDEFKKDETNKSQQENSEFKADEFNKNNQKIKNQESQEFDFQA